MKLDITTKQAIEMNDSILFYIACVQEYMSQHSFKQEDMAKFLNVCSRQRLGEFLTLAEKKEDQRQPSLQNAIVHLAQMNIDIDLIKWYKDKRSNTDVADLACLEVEGSLLKLNQEATNVVTGKANIFDCFTLLHSQKILSHDLVKSLGDDVLHAFMKLSVLQAINNDGKNFIAKAETFVLFKNGVHRILTQKVSDAEHLMTINKHGAIAEISSVVVGLEDAKELDALTKRQQQEVQNKAYEMSKKYIASGKKDGLILFSGRVFTIAKHMLLVMAMLLTFINTQPELKAEGGAGSSGETFPEPILAVVGDMNINPTTIASLKDTDKPIIARTEINSTTTKTERK